MTHIMKRQAGSDPATFGSVFDQIFQNNLSRFFDDSFWGIEGTVNRQQIPVNIRETDKSFEMELIVPGLSKQDLKLDVTDESLTVSFEKEQENKQENQDTGWIKQEFKRQSFSRSFNLDDSIDASKITARYENGILHLSLPKKVAAQKVSRVIEIN
jgi:HSP20 family protein